MVHFFVPPVYSLDTLGETWRLQYSRGAYHFFVGDFIGWVQKYWPTLRGSQTWLYTLEFASNAILNTTPTWKMLLKGGNYTFQIKTQHSEHCFKLAPLYNQSYNMSYIAFPESSQPPKHQDFAFMLFQHTRMGPCSIQNNVPRTGPRVARHWACLTTSAGLGTCLHKWDRKWNEKEWWDGFINMNRRKHIARNLFDILNIMYGAFASVGWQ